MKKIVIASILALLLITLFLVKPFKTHAETPDIFTMNEIYLYDHDNFNFSPNFENDYLSHDAILPSDIETNNQSAFFGWYKDLGYDLYISYYGEESTTEWVYFAIPCYDVLAANFQLGCSVQTPIAIRFGVNFTDGSTQQWDTETLGWNKQILTISQLNLTKNIDCFWWEARAEDYFPSFKFLGITDGYDIGYQHGDSDGFDRGYQSGYNFGFSEGFRDGISQSEDVVIYERILNFNQLINNGDFDNTSNWVSNNATIEIENNELKLTQIDQTAQFTLSHQAFSVANDHKLFFRLNAKSTYNDSIRIRYPYISNYQTITNEYYNYYYYRDNEEILNGNSLLFQFGYNDYINVINIRSIICIDLTQMFGEGNEPTLEECKTIFTASYYPYTTNTPMQMGYYTGYFNGRDDGLNEGINIGESNQITLSWVQSIFQAIQGVLNIQIFPRVTIGIIVGIPFIISLAWFIIKMFRGGGGGE